MAGHGNIIRIDVGAIAIQKLLKREIPFLVVSAEVALIPLSLEQITIVDAAMAAELAQYSWYTHLSNMYKSPGRTPKLYAARSRLIGRTEKGKRITQRVYMHRDIVGAKKAEIVSHLNDQSLDNRTVNLKRTSQAENMAAADGPVEEVVWV